MKKVLLTIRKIVPMVFLLWMLGLSQTLTASHLSGTYFHLEQLDSVRYKVFLTVIRDCNGIAYSGASINYKSGNTQFNEGMSLQTNLISSKDITGLNPNCQTSSRCSGGNYTYGLQELIFVDTVSLTGSNSCEWVISIDECCRTQGINMWPPSTNHYNYLVLNTCISNSTPHFKSSPNSLLVYNQDAQIDYAAEDTVDSGDSISYEIGETLSAPNQVTTYSMYQIPQYLGYPNRTASKPSGFHLDPISGLLEFRPTGINSVSTIVVRAKEWRKINDTMRVISEISMDNQFIVISNAYAGHTNGINRTPSIQTSYDEYHLCKGDTFKLNIATHDSDFDSTYLSWDHSISDAQLSTSYGNDSLAEGVFAWAPTGGHVRNLAYLVTFEARDNICPLPAKARKTIKIYVHDSLYATSLTLGQSIIDSTRADTIRLLPSATNLNNRPVLWSSTGDGHFTNPTAINSAYIQGTNDKINCSYQLKLEVQNMYYCYGNGGNWADSIKVIKRYKPLQVSGNNAIMYDDSQALALSKSAPSGQDIWWTSTGDGQFTDSLSATPKYIPGPNDWSGCGWTIYLHYETEACAMDSDSIQSNRKMTLIGHQAPSSVFRGDSIHLNALLDSGSHSAVLWRSIRDGSFGDSTAINTYYTPGAMDLQNCSYGVLLQEWPINTCLGSTETMNIVIQQPTFDAGSNIQLPFGDSAQLNALPLASTTYQFGYWTTAGDGSFIDSNDAETRYIPGTNDWANCGTWLYWNEIDQACGARVDSLQILRVTSAVNAGSDQVEYYSNGVNFSLLGFSDTANGFQAYWTTSGDGSFNDSFDLNAVYTPGTSDLANCSPITLKLTGYPIGTCTAFDEMTVLVDDSAVVKIVGIQLDSATFDTIHITVTPIDTRGSLTWSSDGTGTFVHQTQGGADYVLSAQDHQRFAIDLSVTRQTPCNTSTDNISIDPQAILKGLHPMFVGMELYPNPAKNVIRLEWKGNHGEASIQIMDVMGKTLIVRQFSADETNADFDLSNLAEGSYLLLVLDKDGNRQLFRFIKK